MRYIIIMLIGSVVFSCNFQQTKNVDGKPVVDNVPVIDLQEVAEIRLTNPNDFRLVLEKLDPGDLNSLNLAGIVFRNCVADTLTRDSMFVVFNDFYNNVAANYPENNESFSTQLSKSSSENGLNQINTHLASYGILLKSSEGISYIEPRLEFLSENYGSGLSLAYREYLTLCIKEQQAPFAEDGLILIPVDSIVSRILVWENFVSKYPDFIAIRMAQDQYTQCLGAFLTGMENSRVFDSETNHLDDNAKLGFESFVAKNPGSVSSGIVRAYLDLLESTRFNYTEKVDSFLLEKVYH